MRIGRGKICLWLGKLTAPVFRTFRDERDGTWHVVELDRRRSESLPDGRYAYEIVADCASHMDAIEEMWRLRDKARWEGATL